MTSINLGIVGCIAASASSGAGSAPTGVSVATSSSGNYNNAIASGEANCNNETMTLDGSEFSTGSADRDVEVSGWGDIYTGCANNASIHYQGYIRATGATSYVWNIVGLTINTSLSNGTSASIVGTASTTQDETGSSDNIGEYLQIAFGGGRGGLTFPADGDTVELDIKATATNSAGSTDSSTLTITYNFTE